MFHVDKIYWFYIVFFCCVTFAKIKKEFYNGDLKKETFFTKK